MLDLLNELIHEPIVIGCAVSALCGLGSAAVVVIVSMIGSGSFDD